MLVLSRKMNESVILGDEVRLTVEQIAGGDGRRVLGGTVRLGFQLPRYVSVYRSELCTRRSRTAHAGRRAERAEAPAGKLFEIADAAARLRIEVPPKVPVCCNGRPAVGIDSEDGLDGTSQTPKVAYHFVCRKEDRITICKNIVILTLEFHRFVFAENVARVLLPLKASGA